jgi:hypothetical protein
VKLTQAGNEQMSPFLLEADVSVRRRSHVIEQGWAIISLSVSTHGMPSMTRLGKRLAPIKTAQFLH